MFHFFLGPPFTLPQFCFWCNPCLGIASRQRRICLRRIARRRQLSQLSVHSGLPHLSNAVRPLRYLRCTVVCAAVSIGIGCCWCVFLYCRAMHYCKCLFHINTTEALILVLAVIARMYSTVAIGCCWHVSFYCPQMQYCKCLLTLSRLMPSSSCLLQLLACIPPTQQMVNGRSQARDSPLPPIR